MYPSIKGWWNLTLLQERFQLSSSVLQCPLSYCQNWQLGPNSNLTAEMLLTAAGLEGNSGRFRECIGIVLCVTFSLQMSRCTWKATPVWPQALFSLVWWAVVHISLDFEVSSEQRVIGKVTEAIEASLGIFHGHLRSVSALFVFTC